MIESKEILHTYLELAEIYEKSGKYDATLVLNDILTILSLINMLNRKKKETYFFKERDIKRDNMLFLNETRKIKALYMDNKEIFDNLYTSTFSIFSKYNLFNKTLYFKRDNSIQDNEIKDLVLYYYSIQGEEQYKIAKELFDNNRIIYINHNRDSLGAAFPLLSRHDGYITICKNRDNLKKASSLVHEIGHIIDSYSIKDLVSTNYHSKIHYIYTELLSCTHEYNFINFLEKNDFYEASKDLKVRYIDDYMHFCTFLYLIGKYKMINQDITISSDKHKIERLIKYAKKNNNLDDYLLEDNHFALLPLSYTLCFPLGIELSSIYKNNPKDLNNVLEQFINKTNLTLEQLLYNAGVDKNRFINSTQIDEEFNKILNKRKIKKTI